MANDNLVPQGMFVVKVRESEDGDCFLVIGQNPSNTHPSYIWSTSAELNEAQVRELADTPEMAERGLASARRAFDEQKVSGSSATPDPEI